MPLNLVAGAHNPPTIVAMHGPMMTQVMEVANGTVRPEAFHISTRRPPPVAKGAEPKTPPRKRITRRVSIL